MKYLIVLIIGIIPISIHADRAQTQHTHSATGAKTWEITANGVHFSLTQILPEQLKAFYVNRGFSLEQIESYVSSCVYMTVLRNDSAPGEIHFISHNWSISVNNNPHKLKPTSEWLRYLSGLGAKKSALIAFRWAQFPVEQSYAPEGNWNQGMLSIGLPPKTVFDAIAKWDIKGREYHAKLTGVQCAI